MYVGGYRLKGPSRLGQLSPNEINSIFGRISPKAAMITGGLLALGGIVGAYGGIRIGYWKQKFLKKKAPRWLFDVGAWHVPVAILTGATITVTGLILFGQGLLLSKLETFMNQSNISKTGR